MAQNQLDATLARPAGWDAFYSFAKVKQSAGGYSGVATFCRQGVACPLDAEEGFAAGLDVLGSAEGCSLGKRLRDWDDSDDAWEVHAQLHSLRRCQANEEEKSPKTRRG